MKALLLNFADEEEEFTRCLQRLGCTVTLNPAWEQGVDAAFVHTLRSLSEVSPYIHALCHLFVQRHTLSPEGLLQLEKLVAEAGVKLQFSALPLYEWRIFDAKLLVGEVKFVQVYSDFEYDKPLSAKDLCAEALAVAGVVKAKLSKAERLRATVPHSANLLGLRTDFVNAASAYFWLSSAAFSARRELRLFGSSGVAAVDVLKREVSVKTLDGKATSMPFLSKAESREREIADFAAALHGKEQPAISAAEATVQQEIVQRSQLGIAQDLGM
ncbi:MAG: hypothetical protein LBL94_12170 [Prevotellaceae bacterium]|jgi:hypothetical protein|nr:hypothetical protein [Prevotellaceae bacterium]